MRNFGRAGVLILLASLLAGSAWADRGHWHSRNSVHWGINIGVPWVYPPYYPYPAYPPRVVVVPAAPPPIYIEQRSAAQDLAPGYWYYCNELQAYYPYVKQCPGPWQQVAPQPPQQ